MVLVEHVLEEARKRLAVLTTEAPVSDAAGILANSGTPLVVVCDAEGIAVGVISSSDIVKLLARAKGDAHKMSAGTMMTRPILSCHLAQELQGVWESMNARSVRAVPVLDDYGRPQGVVHAHDIARAVLNEVNEEEGLLRDYVMGVGYR